MSLARGCVGCKGAKRCKVDVSGIQDLSRDAVATDMNNGCKPEIYGTLTLTWIPIFSFLIQLVRASQRDPKFYDHARDAFLSAALLFALTSAFRLSPPSTL